MKQDSGKLGSVSPLQCEKQFVASFVVWETVERSPRSTAIIVPQRALASLTKHAILVMVALHAQSQPRTNDRYADDGKEPVVMIQPQGPVISVMLAVTDTPTAVAWYKHALGATELWSLESVAGLEIAGAPFFLGEPANNGWESPAKLGITSTRVEVFCDDPDTMIARALEAGAAGSLDDIKDHHAPWGTHRQGGFTDPFGHIWLVGDRSPLGRFPH